MNPLNNDGKITLVSKLQPKSTPSLLFGQSISKIASSDSPSSKVEPSDYSFNTNCNLTQQFKSVFSQITGRLSSHFHESGSFLYHPSQGPISVNISKDDGSFWAVGSSGSPILQIPQSISAEIDGELPELLDQSHRLDDDEMDAEPTKMTAGAQDSKLPSSKVRKAFCQDILLRQKQFLNKEEMMKELHHTLNGKDTLNLFRQTRFKILEKFLPVAGTESSRNRNANRSFNLVPVISGVFMCHSMTIKGHQC
jgi:hypothetical protein